MHASRNTAPLSTMPTERSSSLEPASERIASLTMPVSEPLVMRFTAIASTPRLSASKPSRPKEARKPLTVSICALSRFRNFSSLRNSVPIAAAIRQMNTKSR